MPLLNMMAILAMISLMLSGCSSKEELVPIHKADISEQEEILSRNIEKTGKAYFYFVPDERMKIRIFKI